MDSYQQKACMTASMNARALEETMLTADMSASLTEDEVEEVIERCEQIISCMKECYLNKEKDK